MKHLSALFLFFLFFFIITSFSNKASAAEKLSLVKDRVRETENLNINYSDLLINNCYVFSLKNTTKNEFIQEHNKSINCSNKNINYSNVYSYFKTGSKDGNLVINNLEPGNYELILNRENCSGGLLNHCRLTDFPITKINFEIIPPPCRASVSPEVNISLASTLMVVIENTKQESTYNVSLIGLDANGRIDNSKKYYEEYKKANRNNENLEFPIDLRYIDITSGSYALMAGNIADPYDICFGTVKNPESTRRIIIGYSTPAQSLCPVFDRTEPADPEIGDFVYLLFNRRDPDTVYGITLDNDPELLVRLESGQDRVGTISYTEKKSHTFSVRAFNNPNDPNERFPQGTDCGNGIFNISSPSNPFPCSEWVKTDGSPVPTFNPDRKNDADYVKQYLESTKKDVKCIKVDTAIGDIDVGKPTNFIKQIYVIILSLSGGIALLLIIKAGYEFMTAQGNPEKIQAARDTITSAIVGLLFIIFSLVILEVIGVDILRIPGFER